MQLIDLTGQEFGKWIVLGLDDNNSKRWICRCACGAETSVIGESLRKGHSKQCRNCYYQSKHKDLTGQRFGKWVVQQRSQKSGYWICKCDCGVEQLVQSSHLHYGKGWGCAKCWQDYNKTDDLTGSKFGKWCVLGKDINRSHWLDFWFCKCECGCEKSIYGSHLRLGRSVSCRTCSEQKHKGKLNSIIWYRILRGARLRNIEVDLGEKKDAKKFLYDLLHIRQNCRCALTGLPIIIPNTNKGVTKGETTASLDRIDSKKGYTRDNVQWVHKWINIMKWQLSQDDFIKLCEAVVFHNREKRTIHRNIKC